MLRGLLVDFFISLRPFQLDKMEDVLPRGLRFCAVFLIYCFFPFLLRSRDIGVLWLSWLTLFIPILCMVRQELPLVVLYIGTWFDFCA